jgi:hypothetical protein
VSIDEAMALINSAPRGQAQQVAIEAIKQLSESDRDIAGADLEEMGVVLDYV